MSTDLESIWKGAGDERTPKPQTDVEKIFAAIRTDISSKISELLGASATDRPVRAAAVVEELAKLSAGVNEQLAAATALEAVRLAKSAAASVDFGNLRRQLAKLGEELSLWRMMALSSAGAGVDNARAHFSDAGQWAIHFSTVRMTLSTFFIGLSWGVVSLKWKEFSLPLLYGSVAIWIITGIFLWLFTWQTSKYSKRQKKAKALLPTLNYKPESNTAMRAKTWFGIWSPFVIYLLASVGYYFLLQAWQAEGKNASLAAQNSGDNIAAGSYEGTTTIGNVEVKFLARDPADFATKVKQLKASLAEPERNEANGGKEKSVPTAASPKQPSPGANP